MNIHKIPNQIIRGTLTPLNLSRVVKIVLHHMAHPTWGVKEVENSHVNGKGWSAIGYNFWVGFDGTVYEGRGFNQGAHVYGYNSTSIGIGFQGDYHAKPTVMPIEQLSAGIDLIAWLKGKAPAIKRVVGHRDLEANACPGQYFPFAEMVAGRKEEIEVAEKRYDWIVEIPPEWRATIDKLFNKGIIKGDEHGALNLSEDMIRLLVFNDRAGLYD